MKFRHKNYVRIVITVHPRLTTLYEGTGRLKRDEFLLFLHVVRLCNRPGNLTSTSEGHAYPKLRFKSVAIMTRLKNNLHQGCTNSGHRFSRATNFFFFLALAPNICGSPLWNLLHVTVLAPRIVRCLLYF
jgi:hypothetical protein